nr:glycoside hydrolase 100 family protein [Synechococcus sp. GFB01]
MQPQVVPPWLQDWLDNRGGYLIGNMRTGRPDFRFYSWAIHSPACSACSPHPSNAPCSGWCCTTAAI